MFCAEKTLKRYKGTESNQQADSFHAVLAYKLPKASHPEDFLSKFIAMSLSTSCKRGRVTESRGNVTFYIKMQLVVLVL